MFLLMGYYLRLFPPNGYYMDSQEDYPKKRVFAPIRGPLKLLEFSLVELSSILAHSLTKPLKYE